MGMSGHILGARRVRRLRRDTGLDVVFAVRRGHTPYALTVRDESGHRHVSYDAATGAVTDEPDAPCRESCRLLTENDPWWQAWMATITDRVTGGMS